MAGQPIYATQTQLMSWVSPLPGNAEDLLRAASVVVDQMLIGVCYDVDADDLPSDADVAAVVAEATCAQAAYMHATGDLTGANDGVSQLSVGGVSWSRGSDKNGTITGRVFAPRAVSILRVSGLFPTHPVRW